MKTLTELENEEYATRERASRYEKATDDVYRRRKNITRFEGQIAPLQAALQTLQQMAALAPNVPTDLVFKGTRFLPGGSLLRDMIDSMLRGAIADATVKLKATETALATERQSLAKAQATLDAIEKEV